MEANASQANDSRAVFPNTRMNRSMGQVIADVGPLPYKLNSSFWKYTSVRRFRKEQPPKIRNKHVCFNAGRQ